MYKGILTILIGLSLYLSTAFVFQVFAQACPTQPPVTSVTVEYPGCTGTNCNFTQASCSWGAAAGASSYVVNVTEIETSVAIKANETETSTTTKIVFPITQNRTYKCDVVAASSCGSKSTVVSDQLLCVANGLIGTTAPTSAIPTSVVPPKSIGSPGGIDQTLLILGGAILTVFTGLFLIKQN